MKTSPRILILLTTLLLLGLNAPAQAQEFDEQFDHWPVDLKINGKVIWSSKALGTIDLVHSLTSEEIDQSTTLLLDSDTKYMHVTDYLSLFENTSHKSRFVLVDRERLGKQMSDTLASTKLLWWHLQEPLTSEQHADLLQAREAFNTYLHAGGVVIATGYAAELVGRFRLDLENPDKLQEGLALVPDAIIAPCYEATEQHRKALMQAVQRELPAVGLGFDEQAILILAGRKLRNPDAGKATIALPATKYMPAHVQTIGQRDRRRSPNQWLIDWTQWRREAIDRTLPAFPPAKPEKPFVKNGSLVIVGGGGMPKGLMDRFIQLAGGKEHARLVYVPCAEQDDISDTQRTVEQWKAMGVEHATFIHTKDRNSANEDPMILDPLREATGIWFGGGRQWNMSDSYYGTEAHRLMKGVLQRGGVIGGSSAGASIQARYLARATPIGNTRIMAPGYERGGLGFIGGVAIDQHFSQRGRQKDMTELVERHPQLLGIGLDEATALVVQESTAEVVGQGKAHFYDANRPVVEDEPDYVALPAGSEYDLAERKVLKQTEAE